MNRALVVTLPSVGVTIVILPDFAPTGTTTVISLSLVIVGITVIAEGMAVAPPIMPGWDRFSVRDHLGGLWSCPVTVDNDVNAMALGERHAGVARSIDDLVFVKIGTGIGCGIVFGGKVYRGVAGTAGDIGHIRLDDYGPTCACGGSAVSRRTSAGPRWPATG